MKMTQAAPVHRRAAHCKREPGRARRMAKNKNTPRIRARVLPGLAPVADPLPLSNTPDCPCWHLTGFLQGPDQLRQLDHICLATAKETVANWAADVISSAGSLY